MAIIAYSTEFYAILSITIGVVIVKSILSVLLLRKTIKAKQEGLQSYEFIGTIAILLICLVLSRIFLMIFDFSLTHFNLDSYYVGINPWFWKLGISFANFGMIPIVYVVDKKILQGKFKGIPAIWLFVGSLILLAYPVNSIQDFEVLSTVYIIASLGALIVPAVFIKMIRDTTGTLKTYSLVFLIGLILYTLAGLVVNAAILTQINELTGQPMEVFLYSLQAIFKIVGLVLFSYASSKLAI